MALILIITRTGKEQRVAIDLEDALFHLDPEVNATFTGFPGVVMVNGKFDPIIAARVIKSFNIKDVLKIRPFLRTLSISELDKVCKIIGDIVKREKTVGFRVYVRGAYLSKSAIKNVLFECFKKTGVRISSSSSLFLVIDIVKDVIGFSLVDRKNA